MHASMDIGYKYLRIPQSKEVVHNHELSGSSG